jgi:hypothetical protein
LGSQAAAGLLRLARPNRFMFELQRSRTPVALQILGSGVYWMPGDC